MISDVPVSTEDTGGEGKWERGWLGNGVDVIRTGGLMEFGIN